MIRTGHLKHQAGRNEFFYAREVLKKAEVKSLMFVCLLAILMNLNGKTIVNNVEVTVA
jgi:hypothetical protein